MSEKYDKNFLWVIIIALVFMVLILGSATANYYFQERAEEKRIAYELNGRMNLVKEVLSFKSTCQIIQLIDGNESIRLMEIGCES